MSLGLPVKETGGRVTDREGSTGNLNRDNIARIDSSRFLPSTKCVYESVDAERRCVERMAVHTFLFCDSHREILSANLHVTAEQSTVRVQPRLQVRQLSFLRNELRALFLRIIFCRHRFSRVETRNILVVALIFRRECAKCVWRQRFEGKVLDCHSVQV